MVSKYVPQLDGIRAFCIIFTVLNHTPGRPWFIDGTVGVDVFFPLSGWLITWLLAEERSTKGKIDLMAFYTRRLFRIVPLYYLTIVIYAVAAWGLYISTGNIGKLDELRSALAYLLSFNSEYRPGDEGIIFGHAWTLGIEEKFYVIWPFLLFLARSSSAATVYALAMVGVLFLLFGFSDGLLSGYFGLGLGAGLALWIHGSSSVRSFLERVPLGWPALCGMVLMYAGLITIPNVFWHLGLSISSAMLIVSVWFHQKQALSRILKVAPIVWLGTLTYAIYLLQTLAINLAQGLAPKLHISSNYLTLFCVAYLASIIGAWVVHKLIERPAVNFGRRIAR